MLLPRTHHTLLTSHLSLLTTHRLGSEEDEEIQARGEDEPALSANITNVRCVGMPFLQLGAAPDEMATQQQLQQQQEEVRGVVSGVARWFRNSWGGCVCVPQARPCNPPGQTLQPPRSNPATRHGKPCNLHTPACLSLAGQTLQTPLVKPCYPLHACHLQGGEGEAELVAPGTATPQYAQVEVFEEGEEGERGWRSVCVCVFGWRGLSII